MNVKQIWVAIPIILALLLTGCGLPDKDVKKAKAIPNSIGELSETIKRQEGALNDLKKSEDWSFLSVYVKHENWSKYFTQARSELKHAEDIFQKEVTPLLEKDKSEDLKKLRAAMGRVQKALAAARKQSSQPSSRKDFLLKVRKEVPTWVAKSKSEVSNINKLLSDALATANKAKADYPEKAKDIDGRFSALRKLSDDAHSAFKTSNSELNKVSSGNADYAKLGDATTLVSGRLKALEKQQSDFKKKISELYRSYSKTLVDMRIEYYVEVGRTSWDNDDQLPTEHEHKYSSQVDEKVFEYFDALPDGTIAQREKSLGSLSMSVHIDKTMWAALKINPSENWTRGDNNSEFWIANTFSKAYHKYTIVENGVKKDTDWEAIDENTYWAYEENLGLTIISKPYGMYEEEILKTAAPPGMEYIAKPTMVDGQATGKNQYGEWRQDSSGNSFWHYYGQYAFISNLLGSNRYYYNDWVSYSRRDRGSHYYGRNNGYGTYGSRTYDSSRYSNSNYAKRNQNVVREARASKSSVNTRSTGKSQQASVRGSGPSSRGRGPSGGGK